LLEMSVPGDSLAWFNGCEVLGQRVLADLVGLGPGTEMAVVLGTASAEAADRLATEINVLVARGPVDPALVGTFAGANRSVDGSSIAGVSGSRVTGASGNGPVGSGMNGLVGPGMNGLVGAGEVTGAGGVSRNGPGSALAAIADDWVGAAPVGPDTFALLARHPRARVLAQCRHVPARVGGRLEARGRLGAGGRLEARGRLGAGGRSEARGRLGAGGQPGAGGRLG
jgi:hypothetical protein